MSEFVDHQRSFRLKKLGFNEPCFAYYTSVDGGETNDTLTFKVNYRQIYDIGTFIETEDNGMIPVKVKNEDYFIPTAPLYQDIFDWFRRVHGWASYIKLDNTWVIEEMKELSYKNGDPCIYTTKGKCENYEESRNNCLDQLMSKLELKIQHGLYTEK